MVSGLGTGNRELCVCRRLVLLKIRGETMTPDDRKRDCRKDMLLATMMVVGGLTIAGLSIAELKAGSAQHLAQVTQPLQGTPLPPIRAGSGGF